MYRGFASSFQKSSSYKNQIKKFSIFFHEIVSCLPDFSNPEHVGYSNIFRKWAKSMHYIEEGNANVHKK